MLPLKPVGELLSLPSLVSAVCRQSLAFLVPLVFVDASFQCLPPLSHRQLFLECLCISSLLKTLEAIWS